MSRSQLTAGVLLVAAFSLLGCSRKKTEAPPLTPEAALKSFRLSDDFRIELFASEPHVLTSVEMVFDENGKIYVADMLDYPKDPSTSLNPFPSLPASPETCQPKDKCNVS